MVAMRSTASRDVTLHSLNYPEDGDSTFLRNVGKFLPGHMVSHPRRFYISSCSKLAKLQLAQI